MEWLPSLIPIGLVVMGVIWIQVTFKFLDSKIQKEKLKNTDISFAVKFIDQQHFSGGVDTVSVGLRCIETGREFVLDFRSDKLPPIEYLRYEAIVEHDKQSPKPLKVGDII